jgi:hypothetical protein
MACHFTGELALGIPHLQGETVATSWRLQVAVHIELMLISELDVDH